MSVDEQDGWTEIDVDSPPQEDIKEEIEIETPVTETAEVVEETKTEVEEEKDPELEGIETKGAEKRIRQLIKQRKERDDELAKAHEELNQLRYQMSEVGKVKFNYDEALADAKENEVKSNLENARTKFKEAYDAGDKDNVLDAQEQLAKSQAELKLLEQQKGWIKQQAEQYEKQQEVQKKKYEQSSVERVDPLATEWAENNKWFGKDRTMTAVALSIDAELKERGEDPSDPSFYEKVDARLQEELPQKFSSEEATPSKPRQVVAGRSHSPASKGKVKLTKDDVSLAKKWNIPLEKYAAEKAKAERSDGDYTTVV